MELRWHARLGKDILGPLLELPVQLGFDHEMDFGEGHLFLVYPHS